MAIEIKKSHRGLLHRDLGVKEGEKIPAGKLAAAKNSSDPAERKRATFAANARKWHSGPGKKSRAAGRANRMYGDKS
jgi:hypothetical protein